MFYPVTMWNSLSLFFIQMSLFFSMKKKIKIKLLKKVYHIGQILLWCQLSLSHRSSTPWSVSWSAKHGSELYCFLGTCESPLQLSEIVHRLPNCQITQQTWCTGSCELLRCIRWVQRDWFHRCAGLCPGYLEITELHLHHFQVWNEPR